MFSLTLTILHSERPKLYAILAFLSAIGLKYLNYGTNYSTLFGIDIHGPWGLSVKSIKRNVMTKNNTYGSQDSLFYDKSSVLIVLVNLSSVCVLRFARATTSGKGYLNLFSYKTGVFLQYIYSFCKTCLCLWGLFWTIKIHFMAELHKTGSHICRNFERVKSHPIPE